MIAGTVPPTVLLWDIDGTLLTTGRAGIFALEDAARAVCGHAPDLGKLPTAGLTDAEIASVVIESLGGGSNAATVRAFLDIYERELPNVLRRREGHVMPGVLEILEDLRGEDRMLSLLLTGNTPAGAQAKLRHYGLHNHLDGGAFCVDLGPRADIARRAWELAQERAPGARLDRTFVIGDTPYDIRCGQAIGAHTIAVATGSHSLDELRQCSPTIVIERLPAPAEFRALLSGCIVG